QALDGRIPLRPRAAVGLALARPRARAAGLAGPRGRRPLLRCGWVPSERARSVAGRWEGDQADPAARALGPAGDARRRRARPARSSAWPQETHSEGLTTVQARSQPQKIGHHSALSGFGPPRRL